MTNKKEDVLDENFRLKDVHKGWKERNDRGLLLFPLPGQCIFCRRQFDDNEERDKHEKEIHNL
jgi:hypothetical protein